MSAHIARATLELLEQERLSAGELNILLALASRERTVFDLAVSLDRHTAVIRRAGARLYARGFVHWREVRSRHGNRGTEPLLRITATGHMLLRPIVGPHDINESEAPNAKR